MSAIDAFYWLVKDVFPNPNEQTKSLIQSNRSYLLNLRSEDERHRYVEELTRQYKSTQDRPVGTDHKA
jgi:hypothetical protein